MQRVVTVEDLKKLLQIDVTKEKKDNMRLRSIDQSGQDSEIEYPKKSRMLAPREAKTDKSNITRRNATSYTNSRPIVRVKVAILLALVIALQWFLGTRFVKTILARYFSNPVSAIVTSVSIFVVLVTGMYFLLTN